MQKGEITLVSAFHLKDKTTIQCEMPDRDGGGLASAESEEQIPEEFMVEQSRIPLRPSPQWSVLTLRSFDITSNVPLPSPAMDLGDAGDSPWDGMPPLSERQRNTCLRRQLDVPSRSSSTAEASKGSQEEPRTSRLFNSSSPTHHYTESAPQSDPPQSPVPSASASSAAKPPASRGPRTLRRVGAQPTRLEAVDDSLGPLGPLGDPSFGASPQPQDAPATPRKERSLPTRNAQHSPPTSQSSMNKSMMDSVDLGDENSEPSGVRQRIAPPIQPPPSGPETTRKQSQRSVSIEQAAKPSFDITVGDPHKVGDLTSSHIVYQVRTKV